MKLLAELKRRNVLRMGGLYLVGAWLLVQVVGTLSPMLGAPEWVGRTVLALLAIGFVLALVFAGSAREIRRNMRPVRRAGSVQAGYER